MSLRAAKSLARTPPGCLHCYKQDLGVEKRVTASYMPSLCNLGDLGSAPGLETLVDSVSDRLKLAVDCLDSDGCSKIDFSFPKPSPLSACPFVSSPTGHLSCSRKGLGEDIRLSGLILLNRKIVWRLGFRCPLAWMGD